MFGKIKIPGFRRDVIPFVLAFLLYAFSLGITSSHLLLAAMLLIILFSPHNKILLTKDLQIVLVIIVLSILNECLHFILEPDAEISTLEIVPYSLLIFITIWAAKVVHPKVLKWLLWFTVLEVGIACAQRVLGINSFFAATHSEMAEDGLFYNLKVNGLHVNSSGFAYMSFLSIMIYERFPQCRIMKKIPFWIICVSGIFLAFNRTMMIALMVYVLIAVLKSKKKGILIPILVAGVVILLSLPGVMELIIFQVSRGGDSIATGNALSGREEVYPIYIDFIKNHLFFGNGSFKLLFQDGEFTLHAHNTYLQTFANNGLIIFLLYLFLLITCTNKRNAQFLIPIYICGFFQLFILWGTSYNDFVFYALALNCYCELDIPKRLLIS